MACASTNMLFAAIPTWLFGRSSVQRAHKGRHYQMPAKGGADSVGLLLEKLCNNNRTAGNSAHLFRETLIDYRCVGLALTQAARRNQPPSPLTAYPLPSSMASRSSCSLKHASEHKPLCWGRHHCYWGSWAELEAPQKNNVSLL